MTHCTNNTTKWKGKFFTITFGQAFSLIGSSAVQFALIWWLSSETASPWMLSLAGIAAFIPQMLLGPFAGVIVDRLKRKAVVIIADLANGAIALGFSITFLVTSPPYWSVCIVLMMRGLTSVFHTPAIQSIIPSLVPEERLMKANGWTQFLQSGSFMLGPVIGAILYGAMPLWIILLSDLIGAVFASICLAVVKINEKKDRPVEKPRYFKELKEGFSTLGSDKKLLILFIGTALCMVFTMPLASLYPLMTSSYFALGALYGSIVEFVFALGMMISSFLIASVLKVKNKLLFSAFGLIAMGVAVLASGLLPAATWGFWVFALCCLAMGASMNFSNVPVVTYIQETVPQEKLGRVFSLLNALMSFSMPIGLLIAGPVAERMGVNIWFFVSGAAVVLLGILTTIAVGIYKAKPSPMQTTVVDQVSDNVGSSEPFNTDVTDTDTTTQN